MQLARQIGRLSLVILALWCVEGQASGAPPAKSKLPPIGQRRYVIDPNDRGAPVSIQSDKKATPRSVYLKDPIQPSKDAKIIRPTPRQKPVPVVKAKPISRPARLRFASMPVNGRTKRPRVDFDRALLPMGRADEPLADDFFNKVFEPAQDDSF